MFCKKIHLEKLNLYCYICITAFFAWQVIGIAVLKRHRRMLWSCRRCTLTRNTLFFTRFYTRFFNVDFDSNGLLFLFILSFREVPLI